MQVGLSCRPKKFKHKDIIKKHPQVEKWAVDEKYGTSANFKSLKDFLDFASTVGKPLSISKVFVIKADPNGHKKDANVKEGDKGIEVHFNITIED